MRAAWLPILIAFYSLSAVAWGPGVDNDLVGTSAEFGSNFFLQTVTATGHFGVKPENHNSYFLMQERPELRPSDTAKERAQAAARKQMDLAWFLGYAFYQSSAFDPVSKSTVTDNMHNLKIGLNWELGQRANLIASGGYELLPAENYSQGIFELELTYAIPLEEECSFDESTVDAEQYYLNKIKYDECPKHGAKYRFPNVTLGVIANYMEHTKSATTSGRQAGIGISDQQLNEAESGPELILNANQYLDVKLKLLFYIYDNSPGAFLANTTIGGFRPKANLAVADLQDTTPILLVFPKRTLSLSTGIHLGQIVNLQGEAAYSTWDASTTENAAAGLVNQTFSVGGVLDIAFAPRWKVSASFDETAAKGYSATTGGVGLAFGL